LVYSLKVDVDQIIKYLSKNYRKMFISKTNIDGTLFFALQ